MKKLASGLVFLFYNLLFNGLFLLYFTLVQPVLLTRLGRLPEHTDVVLGVFLVLMSLVELVGIWLKIPSLRENLKAWDNKSTLGAFAGGMVVLVHLGLIMFLFTLSATQAFGVDWANDPPFLLGLLGFAFFMAMVAKEGVLLESLLDVVNHPESASGHRVPAFFRALHQRFPGMSVMLGDVLLSLFSAVAYTVTWERFFGSMPYTATTFWGKLGEYFAAAVLFCMIFPATQLPSTVEACLTRRSLSTRLISAGSFLLTMVIAILSVPRV